MNKTKILVTGGNGFIGHHVCEHILKNTDWEIRILDKLNYASVGFSRLKDVSCYNNERITHFAHDFVQSIDECLFQELEDTNIILHMGAETHVDNSITDPMKFVMSNVVGTAQMLEFARKLKTLKKFFYFSTDEVFGPAHLDTHPKGFKEWDRYKSSNPYAATKAGGEELCVAYANTYKLPILITHTMNVFGERQHPEKFIPSTIRKVIQGETVIIHSAPDKVTSGSRFYIHARNVAEAIVFLLNSDAKEELTSGEKFNIVGEREATNLEIAQFISEVLGKKLMYDMVDFHSSRPGHDLRYGLDGTKLENMGFSYPKTFEQSLEKTILWTVKNPKWLLV